MSNFMNRIYWFVCFRPISTILGLDVSGGYGRYGGDGGGQDSDEEPYAGHDGHDNHQYRRPHFSWSESE